MKSLAGLFQSLYGLDLARSQLTLSRQVGVSSFVVRVGADEGAPRNVQLPLDAAPFWQYGCRGQSRFPQGDGDFSYARGSAVGPVQFSQQVLAAV